MKLPMASLESPRLSAEGRADPAAPQPPLPVRSLIVFLWSSPALQLGCWLSKTGFLNFGGQSWWNFFIYWAIAPLVGWFLKTRHPRARFSFYVFFSCEAYRGIKIHSPALLALSAALILYFQTPALRALYPRVDPREVRDRLKNLARL